MEASKWSQIHFLLLIYFCFIAYLDIYSLFIFVSLHLFRTYRKYRFLASLACMYLVNITNQLFVWLIINNFYSASAKSSNANVFHGFLLVTGCGVVSTTLVTTLDTPGPGTCYTLPAAGTQRAGLSRTLTGDFMTFNVFRPQLRGSMSRNNPLSLWNFCWPLLISNPPHIWTLYSVTASSQRCYLYHYLHATELYHLGMEIMGS